MYCKRISLADQKIRYNGISFEKFVYVKKSIPLELDAQNL